MVPDTLWLSLPKHVGNTTLWRMRIVGRQDRSEIEFDPVKAYRRARWTPCGTLPCLRPPAA